MLFYLSIATVVLCVIMAFFNRWNKNTLLLSAYFFCFATYSLTHYFMVEVKSTFWLAIFFTHFSPLWYLIGPLLYFYVRNTLADKFLFCRKDIFHFFPAIIHLIGICSYLFQPFAYKLHTVQSLLNDLDNLKLMNVNTLYSPFIAFVSRPFLIIIYCIASFIILFQHRFTKEDFKETPYNQYKISRRFLLTLVSSSTLICLNFLFLIFYFSNRPLSVSNLEASSLHTFTGIFFLCMVASLLLFPQILYGVPRIEKNKITPSGNLSTNPPVENLTTENNPADLDNPNPFEELSRKIEAFIYKNKPYLNEDFSLTDLSIEFKVPHHHISYCFRNILKIKFTDLRTSLRIEYAAKLLQEEMALDLSINGIAKKSGFPSRSSFYSSFKKIKGLTPIDFLEKIKDAKQNPIHHNGNTTGTDKLSD